MIFVCVLKRTELKAFKQIKVLSEELKEENQKDEIEDYKFELKENLNIFKDKLFMPLENNKAVNIPLIIGGEIKVIILDTENGEVTSFNNDK